MQADFWLDRWARNQIGFHQPTVNGYLAKHWPALGIQPAGGVLVPLCGKSLDMAWLAAQGHRVMGVELSEKAAEAFFSELWIQPSVRQQGPFSVYEGGGVAIWCGDFFALSAADVAGCEAFYDRAALIALPEPMRVRYAAHLREVLSASARGLLITLDYPQEQMSGPPFAVADEEMQQLFAEGWRVGVEEACDVLAENGKFLNAGVERLVERVYRLNPPG